MKETQKLDGNEGNNSTANLDDNSNESYYSNVNIYGSLDAHQKEEFSYEEQKHEITCYCCPRVISGKCCGFINYYINPVVMIISILIMWGFVSFTISNHKLAADIYDDAQTLICKYFTWLYVSALTIFVIFAFYLIFSKYGDIKLGPDDEPPKHSLGAWFSMLFSAGVGVGLYYFGVAEPVFYINELQDGGSRWYDNQINKQGMDAINLAWFHWGLSASATYVIAGLPLAYHHHRKGEPMRESVCFIELIGKKYVNSAIGNIIDICSVVGTMFGVSTSLGLGALQINAGLNFVFNVPESFKTQMLIIWGITICATISVLSGIDKGIKLLSKIFIFFSSLVLMYIFFSGDSMFYLNLLIQGIGYHLQWLLELQFSTQAFEQAGFYDTNDAQELASVSNQRGWMSGWTIFYWAWWISWAPFVGIFLANISRGRTVREFIIGNMVVPTIITCVWFTIIGGWGLYNEMGSIQNDMDCKIDSNDNKYSELNEWNDHTIIKLSCYGTSSMFFAALQTLPFKEFTSIVIIIAIVLGFVTSSDSASMVIDILTASGNEHPPKIQRLFWALSEGAVASSLLAAVNDGSALVALQTASLIGALPLTIILLFELLATMKAFKKHFGEINESELTYWKHDLFSVFNLCDPMIYIAIICPPIIQTKSILQYYTKLNSDNERCNKSFNISMIWVSWMSIIMFLVMRGYNNDDIGKAFFDYSLTLYVVWIFLSIVNRRNIKEYSNIDSSNILFDILSWIFCPCCASLQELNEFNEYHLPKNNMETNSNKPVELQAFQE